MRGSEGHHAPPLAGRYGGVSSNKRASIGQAFTCQTPAAQQHQQEKKQFPNKPAKENNDDDDARQGLRSWRIHSYLSAYEDSGEEGLVQPMGPDAFEDPPPPGPLTATENSSSRIDISDSLNVPSKARPDIPRPRYGKPLLPDSTSRDSAATKSTDVLQSVRDLKPFAPEKRESEVGKEGWSKGGEKGATKEVGVDMEAREAPDHFLSKHESFRSRVNPLLQRSSRLRSSLIFSSSKGEMHSGGLGLKPATEEDEQLDAGRTSSIVAQILEKRRSLSREPFEWRKKAEEREKEKERERETLKEEKESEPPREEKKLPPKDEIKTNEEPKKDVSVAAAIKKFEVTASSSLNMNDPANRLQYFNDLAAKRKASKMGTDSSLKEPEPAEKKSDVSDKPPPVTPKVPTVSVTSTESEPKKQDISTKLAELTRRPSFSSAKPPISATKPPVSHLKLTETPQPVKEESSSEGQKGNIFKSFKPLPSPKLFKKEPLKFRGLNPRRISCDEDMLTADATDAEKSELKKSRSHSSSTMTRDEAGQKVMGSNTSINTLGEGKGEGKTLDFLKKQTQRLKGFLGPKDKEKRSSVEDRGMSTVIQNTGDSSRKLSSSDKDTGFTAADQTTANHKSSTGSMSSSRHQSPGSSVLFSSNLRDDTKVILEQISANSQKNRQEREEAAGDKDGDAADKGQDKQNSLKRNRFLRPVGTTQEREGLLKRIESLRKEKKVYSRFEVTSLCG